MWKNTENLCLLENMTHLPIQTKIVYLERKGIQIAFVTMIYTNKQYYWDGKDSISIGCL